MRIDIFTLFPEMFPPALENSIVGRARRRGFLQVCCHQLRDFSPDRRGRVDDTVFGGGKGMLLSAEPFARGLDALREHLGQKPYVVYLSPRGKVLNQQKARELALLPALCLLWGTMCSPAASCPPCSSPTPSAGCCPGCSPTRAAFRRRAIFPACWNIPSIPGPRSGGAAPCRKFFSAGIMGPSRPGGGRNPSP